VEDLRNSPIGLDWSRQTLILWDERNFRPAGFVEGCDGVENALSCYGRRM